MPSTINQVFENKNYTTLQIKFQLTNFTHVIKHHWATSNWTC
jgi:hypothetical protein